MFFQQLAPVLFIWSVDRNHQSHWKKFYRSNDMKLTDALIYLLSNFNIKERTFKKK